MRDLEKEVSEFHIDNEEEVSSYHRLRRQLLELGKEFQEWLVQPQYAVPFMQPGRLIEVKHGERNFGFGVVVNFKKINPKDAKSASNANPLENENNYVVEALLHVTSETAKCKSPAELTPASEGTGKGEMIVVPIFLNLIQQISSVKVFLPKDLRVKDNRKVVIKTLEGVRAKFGSDVPVLDPIKDMKIHDRSFKELTKRIAAFEERLSAHSLSEKPKDELASVLEEYGKKVSLRERADSARAELKKAKSLLQMSDLKCMKRVLRRLGYCTASDVIEVKGRIACELSSADELLLTEMVFNGLFDGLGPEQSAAVLSCFVFDENCKEMPKLTEALSGPLRQMQEMARRIAKVSKEAKITIDEDAYVDQFRPGLMDVVHEWCKGASFAQLCKMTDVFEGSVIRCIRRLEELLRQMVQAAKNIGNTELENKFSEAIRLLKRDIVFAASLYL